MKTKVLNLKNNIRLIYTYVKDVNGVDVQLCFKAGALNDPKGKSGLAHFCEHALSSAFSTEKHSRNERRYLKNKYTYSNASTSASYVKFFLQVAHDKFEEAFDLMTESFYSLKYIPDEFESERKIIYDEILTRQKTNEREFYNIFYHKIHKEPEYQNIQTSAAGVVDTVKNITIEDIRKYIEQYFTQKNLTIVISGKITLRNVLKNISKYIYSRIPLGEKLGFDFENYKGFKSPCFIKSPSVEEGKSMFVTNYAYDKCEKFSNRKQFFIESILNACLHEKFFEFYRTNNNLCYNCYAGLYDDNIYKLCEFTVLCNDNNIEEVTNQFKNFLTFFEKEYNIELFNKQKERKLSQVNFDLQSLSRISTSRFGELNYYNDICNNDNKIKYDINSVTFEQTKDLWNKIIKVKPYLFLITSKEEFDSFDYKNFSKK